MFESLEDRRVLTTLSLWTYDVYPYEHFGAGATMGELYRYGGDLSQPLTATLTSSDETELVVPATVTIPANETSVVFPVDTVDDTLLDGEQLVYITATAGQDSVDTPLLVQDYETAEVVFDQSALVPGDSLTGTVTVSVSGNTDPVSVPLTSTRPDEIASTSVVVPVGQQSVSFAIPVTSDGVAEGPHMVKVGVPWDAALFGNTVFLSVADTGVNTIQPLADGHALDADQDGLVFEQLTLNSSQITTQAASGFGSFGETRGIMEFDVSAIPDGAVIQSAVLTVEIGGQSGSNPTDFEYFVYAGNGSVESADALESSISVGQLTTTPGIDGLKSTPIILDTAALQTLVDGSDYVGIVSRVAAAFANTGARVSVNSSEHPYTFSRPSLHLVWTENNAPQITANSLAVVEGQAVTLSSDDLAATDPDSDDASLVFSLSNVSRGEFLVAGSPAASFTQAELAAGQVEFVHDDSEYAPTYNVSVSDGSVTTGPQTANIGFTNVNDQEPVILPGQVFDVDENAGLGVIVGTVSFSDADLPGDSFAFVIVSGDDDGVFAIDNNGVLTVADDVPLNYEQTTSYVLTIAVSDGVNAAMEDVVVDVIDGEDIIPVLTIDNTDLYETDGPTATYGHITRQGGDLSQPLTVILTSGDESKLTVPASVNIPEFETDVSFPIGVIDDTLLGGSQVISVTASAVGGEATSTDVTVHDVETVSIEFDQLAASPGDTINATISVSTTDRVDPLTIYIESTRPNEIAPFSVLIDPTEQSIVVPLSVLADGISEGLHPVIVSVAAEGYNTYYNPLAGPNDDSVRVELSDPGVVTVLPVDDSSATDADKDGLVFEQLAPNSQAIFSQAAASDGSFGETRGILEFDVSAIPANAIVESAVLTLDVNWAGDYPAVNDVILDVFAFQGNGVVESADANELSNSVGQLFVDTNGSPVQASFAIVLDTAEIQTLMQGGDYLGVVTQVEASLLQYYSKEYFRVSSRPALHLVVAYPPVLTTNALTLSEGEAVVLTSQNLAATDQDSVASSLTFQVSNLSGGHFLVEGVPAISFTQAQITAGQVMFAHDDGEAAPTYSVEVTDGAYSDGPQAASINFSNINDNAPAIPAGQTFAVSENAAVGTSLGTILFSDNDLPGDVLVASIAAGNEDGVFGIDASGNFTVVDNSNLDFETNNAYSLTVSVYDGLNTTSEIVSVTVEDVDETKFYVVNNGSNDRTHEYDALGAETDNYPLASDNSSPRGAASTAAGDRVWVIDNNRIVYVYDTAGAPLGSWTAGSLSNKARPEGIATDGTDVWLVDRRSDRVYRYAGAASRLSGSQSAAGNFSLASGNSAPYGITTDGSSLWVVNDSSTDRVYKYTIGGSLMGSWSIDSANGSPTGITIDPSDVSDIWIVDKGDNVVYQYSGAASRTSGSQSAAATFSLSSANTNPQGITDPPAGGNIEGAGQQPTTPIARQREEFFVDGVRLPKSRSSSRPYRPAAKAEAPADREIAFATYTPQRHAAPRRMEIWTPLASDSHVGDENSEADWDIGELDLALEGAFGDRRGTT